MDRKKFTISIISTIIAVAVIALASVLIFNHYEVKADGYINVEIVDIDGETINEKRIGFLKGDTILDLLEHNFENVTMENGMLMTIDKLTTPSDWKTFICIYVNDEMSQVGLLDIKFENGTKISFVDSVNEWA